MILLWSVAWGSDCAEPFTRSELESLVSEAASAVENDDVSGYRGQYRLFVKRVPCLDEAIPREPWADLLVLDAIVRFAEGQDVSAPLGTARAIDADVDLPPFLSEIAIPQRDIRGRLLPESVVLYVDGRRVTTVEALDGDHVVQRKADGAWESTVGSSIPKSWTKVIVPPRLPGTPRETDTTLWARVGLGVGAVRLEQRPEEPGDYLPEAVGLGGGAALQAEVRLRADAVGAFSRLSVPLWIGRLSGGGLRTSPELELGVAYAVDTIRAEAGAWASFTPLLEGDRNKERLDLLPAVGIRWIAEEDFDAGLTVGAWLDSLRVRARGGWRTEVAENRVLRLGLDLGVHRRAFVQELEVRDRGLRQSATEATISIGLVVP